MKVNHQQQRYQGFIVTGQVKVPIFLVKPYRF
jgi:hypothetical protein